MEHKELARSLFLLEQKNQGLLLEKLLFSINEPEEYLEEIVRESGLVFHGDCFAVVVASIDPVDPEAWPNHSDPRDVRFFSNAKENTSAYPVVPDAWPKEAGTRSARFFTEVSDTVINILSEVIQEDLPCYGVRKGNGLPLILDLCSTDIRQGEKNLDQLIRRLRKDLPEHIELLRREFGFLIQLHIGPPCKSLHKLELSLRTALQLSVFTLGNNIHQPLYTYLDYDKGRASLMELNSQANQSSAALIERDLHKAGRMLTDAIRAQLGAAIYDYSSLRMFLISTLSNVIPRMTPPLDAAQCSAILLRAEQEIKEYFSAMHRGCGTLDDLAALVRAVLQPLGTQEESPNRGAIQNTLWVADYLKEHFHDSNLSLTQVGDQLGVSLSQISREFRRTTGHRMIDYLHRLRVEEANRLLVSTQLNVSEIARQVGYVNDSAFIRAYKRYEGVTPGTFRRLHGAPGIPPGSEIPLPGLST